ncbi:DegT/DnrJ/EryC1/StrS family aminotransferase [Akkermansiaceae bacterium]|nr:DegT/DnrJ/EryC1/StrS family aminotransferase [Akkermansiaceae bacterium]
MINVTKSFFPPLELYQDYVKKIWANQWLTNNGALFKELSFKLKEKLAVNNIIPMTNGTLPLQIALNAFGKEGEIITTPFSYVATTAAIVWEKCTPVFVDINADYLTIDETKIEAAITAKTTCILATHVYGNPCHVMAIDKIAKKYGLKVIYDAAHCFGVNYNGQSIFNFGDVSTCSFHATKLFHTGEGGAIFCQDQSTLHEMKYRNSFGHNGQEEYFGLGINAKMSELQAAMGLSVLPYIDQIISNRKRVCDYYTQNLNFTNFSRLKLRANTKWNYSYYPVIFNSEQELLNIKKKLSERNIMARRYFYPSLTKLPYVEPEQSVPIAEDIAVRILCLPLYPQLTESSCKKIVYIINLHDS